MINLSEKNRSWLYGIVVAVLPILAVYGLVTQDQIGQWLTLAAALLGTASAGLAQANVPGGKHRKPE